MKDKKTLAMDDIVTDRKVSRRSTLAMIGVSVVGAVAVAAAIPETAEAQCSDSDPYDPGGRGRHCGRSGCSDSDPSDPGGNGRRCGGRPGCSGISDSDPSDPAGCGRGRRSCSDRDPYDPGGAGRHC
jgi:hypothetical protein